jgi:undecaprenyl-diphosphatase
MNYNVSLFFKINKLSGKNRWLDFFGKAGAEWVIIAMLGWFIASLFIDYNSEYRNILLRLGVLFVGWLAGWCISILIGKIVREPRPHVTYPESKLLFQPYMSWKSFPSDHAMSAWLIFFLAFMFGLPGMEGLAILALWVCWGRVYAGLHYPFDIVGGMTLAGFVAVVCYNLMLIFF